MSRPRKIDYSVARKMHQDGMSKAEIARKLGCGHSAIDAACDELKRILLIEQAKVRTKRNPEAHREASNRYARKRRAAVEREFGARA